MCPADGDPEHIDFSWTGIAELMGDDPDAATIDWFLRRPETVDLLDVAVRRAGHRLSIDLAVHGDDLRSEAATLLWQMLTDPAVRASASRISGGLGVALCLRFADRCKALVESPSWTGSRGMSGVVRRRRALQMHRRRMEADLGREPSDDELIADFNARVSARRADAARQGALASLEDLRPAAAVSLDQAQADGWGDRVAATVDDVPLLTAKAGPLIAAILRRASLHGNLLSDFVRAWIGSAGEPDLLVRTFAQCQQVLGLSDVELAELSAQALVLARQVLADDFGIVSV